MQKENNIGRKNNPVFIVTESAPLMDFLIAKLPHKNRNNIKSLLRNKQVLVNDRPVSQFNYLLAPGQEVEISGSRNRAEKQFREFKIVFEDESLIIIDKAAGLLSIATKNEKRNTAYSLLSEYVKTTNSAGKIFIVHRLDRETSGLMIFAKNEEVKRVLQENWNEAVLEKSYIAVVEGAVEKQEGTIVSYLFEDKVFRMHSSDNPKKGLKAVTHFSVLKTNKNYSMLKVNIETGRKNQIRVHMQEMGHCIIGDKKYGATASPIRRLGLHAQKLAFIHPVTNEKLVFETKIPTVFSRVF
ncbi:MAG: RluA family pseudouridine synthase [Prolixibacteraceae bacterium]|nr:RluA family pseudouridine synthase [Prolixibacteraceae bacterium]